MAKLEGVVVCKVCGHEGRYLGPHLRKEHNLSVPEYKNMYPGAEVWPPDASKEFKRFGASEASEKAGKLLKLFHTLGADDQDRVYLLAKELAPPPVDKMALRNARLLAQQQERLRKQEEHQKEVNKRKEERANAKAERDAVKAKEKADRAAAREKAKQERLASAQEKIKERAERKEAESRIKAETHMHMGVKVDGFGNPIDPADKKKLEAANKKGGGPKAQAARTTVKQDLMKLSRKQLLDKATSKGIDLPANSSKNVIVEALLRRGGK